MKRSFVNTERFQEEVESVHFYRFDGHLSKDGVPPQMQWFIIRLQIWKNNKWRHTNFQTQPLFIDDYKGLYYALQWQSGFWASPVVVELVSYISSYIPILSSLYIYIEWANALVPPTPPFVGEVGSMLGTGPQFQDGLGVAQRASHAEAL